LLDCFISASANSSYGINGKLMQHWADRIDTMRDGGNVVAITAPTRETA
jgi:hypothetical protein